MSDPFANLLKGTPLAPKPKSPSMRNAAKLNSETKRIRKLHNIAEAKTKKVITAARNKNVSNAEVNRLFKESQKATKNALNAAKQFFTLRRG